MTPEQQRDALKVIFKDKLEGERWLFNGDWIYFDPIRDSNAMRAIIESLPSGMRNKLMERLEVILLGSHKRPMGSFDLYYLVTADPKYLAQAVLEVES